MKNTDVQTPPYRNKGKGQRAGALTCLALSMLISTLGVSIAQVALPTFVDVFEASMTQAQWVTISYLIAVTATVLGAGSLGDMVGRCKLLRVGTIIFMVTSFFCAASFSLPALIVSRIFQGIGGVIIMSQVLALASTELPERKTGAAMGLLCITAAVGTALGPVIGGVMIDAMGWRSIFFIMLPLGVLSYLLSLQFLREGSSKNETYQRKFDGLGVLSIAIFCTFYALLATLDRALFHATGWFFLGGTIVSAYAFFQSQKKAKNPVVGLALLKNKKLNGALFASFTVDSVAMTTLVVGPFYLSYALELSPVYVGGVMAVGPFLAALSGYPAGMLVDVWGAQKAVFIGMFQVLLGVLSFIFLPLLMGVSGYMMSLAILAPGRQLFLAANNTLVMLSFAQEKRGLISGALNLSRNLGLLTGASLMSTIFAWSLQGTSVDLADKDRLDMAFAQSFLCGFLLVVMAFVFMCVFYIERGNRHVNE